MAIGREEYLETLRERARTSRVHRRHQATGLLVAELLGDQDHRALYMKLAKDIGNDRLLSLAKDVAGRANVKNKGAYLMRLIAKEKHGER